MSKSNILEIFIKIPEYLILYILSTQLFNNMPDELYLKIKFRIKTKKKLDLENPVTYNEKIQWLKINDRKSEYANMVDKYEVRKYVAEKLDSKYLVPMIGIWDRTEDIDFEELPDSFILKCTHDSGSCIKCTDKSKLKISKTKRKLNRNLKKNYYYKSREWLYKDLEPRIICEELLKEGDNWDIKDYKIFCFHGEVKFIRVKYVVKGEIKKQTFDTDWNLLKNPGMQQPDLQIIKKPQNLEEMLHIASILSENIPQLRVDLYLIEEVVYFSEMTFYHSSGYKTFELDELVSKMGAWLKLPVG